MVSDKAVVASSILSYMQIDMQFVHRDKTKVKNQIGGFTHCCPGFH